MTHPYPAIVARFWSKVDKSGECWIWTGGCTDRGYGKFGVSRPRRTNVYAHRFAYEIANGPVPDGMVLDHLCRNTSCVRPDHLEAVTNRENTLRGLRGRLVTHCAQGHEYTDENTYWRPTDEYPRRQCRECRRIRDRIRAPRRRAAARELRRDAA